jgi:glucose/arabinose dehydrogenase
VESRGFILRMYIKPRAPHALKPWFTLLFRTKIVRCYFYFAGDVGSPNISKDTLTIMDTVFSNLPGSNDHNSGRMTLSQVVENDGTYKLYYTVGDMGAGQFNNSSRTNHTKPRHL